MVSDPHASFQNHKHGDNLGLAVCIVGQMSRMEVETKLGNLFNINAKGMGISVFAVLEVHGSYFQTWNRTDDPACFREMSPDEFENKLAPHLRNAVYLDHAPEAFHSAQWPAYEHSLELDMSQFHHVASCATLIQEYEKQQHGVFSHVMRIRDNAVVTRPFPVQSVTTVLFKDCASWGGLQDKVMLAPRDWGLEVLVAPYEFFRKIDNNEVWPLPNINLADEFAMARNCTNSEQILKTALVIKGVPFELVGPDQLPVVDARCSRVINGKKKWCLVPLWKDCRSPGANVFSGHDDVETCKERQKAKP